MPKPREAQLSRGLSGEQEPRVGRGRLSRGCGQVGCGCGQVGVGVARCAVGVAGWSVGVVRCAVGVAPVAEGVASGFTESSPGHWTVHFTDATLSPE